jgi:hypothetical protein
MPEKRIVLHGTSLRTRSDSPFDPLPPKRRVFLLSPANAGGVRARNLVRDDSQSDLALRLRAPGATLGEVYTFLSSLYFRGKLEYATMFQNPPGDVAGIHVITPNAGLLAPGLVINMAGFQEFSVGNVHPSNPMYRKPLDRDLEALDARLDSETQIVLLGSVATPKYLEPVLAFFPNRVIIPKLFVGKGDMSRGALLLRSVSTRCELSYIFADNSLYSRPAQSKSQI